MNMHIYMCVLYAWVYMLGCMYVCVDVFMRVYMYLCIYLCMHVLMCHAQAQASGLE
jgi:hypothetical protein